MIRGAIMRICFLSKSSVQNVEKRNMNNMIARFISSNTESLEKHERARFHPARKVIGWRNIGHNPFGLTQHPIFPIQ